jgi:hypothetical protein
MTADPETGPAAKQVSIGRHRDNTLLRCKFPVWGWTLRDILMSVFQTVWTDLPALIRLLERDALTLIATAPAEAVRLAYLASEMRRAAR